MYVKQHSPSLLDWPILLNCMEWIGDAAAYVCKNCLMDKEKATLMSKRARRNSSIEQISAIRGLCIRLSHPSKPHPSKKLGCNWIYAPENPKMKAWKMHILFKRRIWDSMLVFRE